MSLFFKVKCFVFSVLSVSLIPAAGLATEVEIDRTLEIKAAGPVIDMATSLDGQWVFVLGERKLQVFTLNGELNDTVELAADYQSVTTGPEPDVVYLSSPKSPKIEKLHLAFIRPVNTKGSPVRGHENAPVSIAVFSDFQCPYCSKIGPFLEEVREKYPEQVNIVYKHFPLPSHPKALPAAMASMAAHAQGKFWEYHDLLYKNMRSLSAEKFTELAEELGLDKEAFEKASKDQKTMMKVQSDYQEGNRIGVRGTPSVFVNGRLLQDRSMKGVSRLIDAALEKAKKEK